jgi:hypothetical protein
MAATLAEQKEGKMTILMTQNVESLLYWVAEREAIRKKKEAGQFPPYTRDVILSKFRFCNVRRKHDRVSRWLLKHVLTKHNLEISGVDSFIMFTALCRWINWPPTIEATAMLWPSRNPDWDAVAQCVRSIQGKVWTGAYMIPAGDIKGRSKADYVVRDVIEAHLGHSIKFLNFKERAFADNRRETAWRELRTIPGYGSFMAGQIVDDWAWTPLLENATDHFTWAPQGPGSLRGFNRIKGLPLNTRHSMEEWCAQLQEWRQLIVDKLGKEYEDLDLMSTQNVLCETDKYLRTKSGGGRPRSTYRPETAYAV